MRGLSVLGCAVFLLLAGCRETPGTGTTTGAPGTSTEGTPRPPEQTRLTLLPASIRSAARRGTPSAAGALKRLLLGEGEQRAWAALGVAPNCRKNPSEYEPWLALSLAGSLSSRSEEKSSAFPLGWALASCGTPSAGAALEDVLTNTSLSKGPRSAVAIALGKFVDASGRLGERAQTRLLDLAEQEKDGVFLYPLTRLSSLPAALAARTLEVAAPLLEEESTGRRHTLLALGATGTLGLLPLRAVLESPRFSDLERATAAQALARLGDGGQKELRQALESVALPSVATEPGWLTVRALLRALQPTKDAPAKLGLWATVPLEDDAPEPLRRRLVYVRCRAAELLAGERFDEPRLRGCDPDEARGSVEGKLALLHVLSRTKLLGDRATLWRALAEDRDPRVAGEALRVGFEHRELDEETRTLDARLDHPPEGVRLALLRGYALRPELTHGSPKDETVRAEFLERLGKLLSTEGGTDVGLETRAAAIEVAGAIRALSTKPAVEKFCSGEEPSFYAAAERALALLGDPNRKCEGANRGELKFESGPVGGAPDGEASVTLEIESDVGVLSLHFDVADAPIARATLVREFDSGRYNGIFVSAISEGYGVQFGDRDGDGVLDLEMSLPDERTPLLFERGLFGLSGFQRGSALPHLFVALSDAFPLSMERVILGRTSGPFELLVPGDRLRSFRVVSK